MERSKEQRVHNVFESISVQYDKMNSVISFQQHKKWREVTMKQMNIQAGSRALDLCCGTGDWTKAIADQVGNSGDVIGLDFSESMLEVAKEKLAEKNNVKLVHGNAMSLPFEDNTFDYVTIGFGLRNVPDYMVALKEMHRVLKPNGMAVCLETSQPTMIGFRQLYYLYFRFIMPFFGKVFAKSYDEYSWLQESARDFPGMKQLATMFENAGFNEVFYKSHCGGVAATHIGYKIID